MLLIKFSSITTSLLIHFFSFPFHILLIKFSSFITLAVDSFLQLPFPHAID